ncbi:nucleotidyltransferase domain-containing protein [Thermanaeromonas sp. C210]|uniref:nucleotidyltransferase domain-containing protein n=1 Tax=Thermanaeromonas sp. C210 TaxID=2731925 RepID=UPI00155D3240|nr:nucleotidyltransferase domain-containing protein [Thermanaeromonas sp. C210]GFN22710.1 DNA polymerase beta-like region [Thermanaeromonas sp. C210]
MGEERADIRAIVEQFAEALKTQGIQIDKIILFGSRARGDAREDSDIDLLVVSPDFARMPLYRRYEVLGRALARVMQPIEPLACTPEEVQVEKLSRASFLYDVLARQKIVEYQL